MSRPDPQFNQYAVAAFFGSLGILLFVKLVMRPWVLSHDASPIFSIVVFSFPNFVEAVVVLTLVYGIMMFAKGLLPTLAARTSKRGLLVFSLLVAGTYVLTQELSPNNLGGHNVVDPWDVGASLLGLAMMTIIFVRFGLMEERS